MRCAACDVVIPEDAARCPDCGRPPGRKPRRREVSEKPEAGSGADAEVPNRDAAQAYRLVVLGIVPVAGLLLGPAGLVLGLFAQVRGRGDPEFTATGPARAAVLLGAVETVSNWLGITLMAAGVWNR